MKHCLLLIFILFTSCSVFAQYNQFKDDYLRAQKQRKYFAQHKIKQVDEYTLSDDDTTLTNKHPRCSVFYDTKGRIVKEAYPHHTSAESPDSPSVIYSYNTRGKLISKQNKAFYHQLKTYTYNTKGNLLTETYITNIPTDNTYGYRDYTITNSYSKKGNVIQQTNFGAGNVLNWKKYFTYTKHHTIVKCLTQTPGSSTLTRDVYHYRLHNHLLTKRIRSYKNDTLIIERQFIYDKHHNQIKGYEIKDGVTKTVWNYTYNHAGQVIQSTGGPASVDGLTDRDLRKDGLVPITYAYNAYGLLMQLTKTNYFPNMGKEVTSIQKFVYKTY